jgi:hypothetical protein
MTSSLNHVGFNLTKNKLQLVEVVIQSMKYCLENVDEHIFEEEFDFGNLIVRPRYSPAIILILFEFSKGYSSSCGE